VAELQTAVVEREDAPVLCLRVDDTLPEIRRAWPALERTIGSLRGRRFFGAADADAGWYRACVQVREGDLPDELGLELWTLPGGRYLRARLRGEPPAVYDSIGPTFEQLASLAEPDPVRPWIEDYRRHNLIDLLMPVP
jgi:hypothetical protein